MNKLFVLSAAMGFFFPSALISTAFAQDQPPQPEITQFLSDSAPAECTIRATAIAPEAPNEDISAALDSVELTPCEAVSGTDDGNSKNFNFLNLTDSNYYKIITTSEPAAEIENDSYAFSVQGVQVIPIDEDGNSIDLSEVDYLFPASEQTCIASSLEQPRNVVCNFAVRTVDELFVGEIVYVGE